MISKRHNTRDTNGCIKSYMSEPEMLQVYKDFRRTSGFYLYFESKTKDFYCNISQGSWEMINDEVQQIAQNYSHADVLSAYGMSTYDSIYIEYWWSKSKNVGYLNPCIGDIDLFNSCIKVAYRNTLITVNRLQLGFIILGTAINNCISKSEPQTIEYTELVEFKSRFVELVECMSDELGIADYSSMIV